MTENFERANTTTAHFQVRHAITTSAPAILMGATQSRIDELVNKHGKAKVLSLLGFVLFLFQSTIGRSIMDRTNSVVPHLRVRQDNSYSHGALITMRSNRLRGLPPGPMPLPIIGTFHLLSPPNTPPGVHRDYYRLSKQWGPIYTLYFGSNKGVVLNTPELFYEALKEKQDETSVRPVLDSFDAITHYRGIAMNNGPQWKELRTMFQQLVTSKQNGELAEPLIMEEVTSTLHTVFEPTKRGNFVTKNLRLTLRRESINIILRKLLSIRFKEEMTPKYVEVQDWVRVIFEHLGQGSPSDFMPIMKLFPNAQEKHMAEVCVKLHAFLDDELTRHRRELPNKNPDDYDFVDRALFLQKENKVNRNVDMPADIDIRIITWDALAGGLDTSATSMEWLILTLAKHPRVQQKLHKALDEVVGPNRLPTMADEPKLEYVTAVIAEIFRWKHFAPNGMPHEAAVDMELGGYKIPKGTQLFFNFFSLHMNPKYWKDPEEFRPERFLEEERFLLQTFLHTETYFKKPEAYKLVPYGQGQRRCAGYGFGRIVLWLTAAAWIHCFTFGPEDDSKEIDLDTEYLGITMNPKEQQIKVTPRPAARLLKKFEGNPKIVEL